MRFAPYGVGKEGDEPLRSEKHQGTKATQRKGSISMRVRCFSLLALVVALVTALTIAPATSARTQTAARTTSGSFVSDPFHGIPVTGTSKQGTFTGTFDVTRFAVGRKHHVYAVGVLNGVVKNGNAVVKTVTNRTVRIPVRTHRRHMLSAQATCQILHLVLGPLDLNLLGLKVHLNQVVLDVTAQSGPGNLLGNLLCSVANLLNRTNTPLGLLTRQLNRLLSLSQLLQNIPLAGTTANNGTFAGTLDVRSLTVQNGALALVGVVNGVAKDAAGNVVKTITNAPVTIPLASANGTCKILHLELGPLDLNLLGLQVHLNRVVLDITAQSGPGKLLGNLLCSIANLLNGNQLQQVADLLNGILPVRA
jgi:hypothetical protein